MECQQLDIINMLLFDPFPTLKGLYNVSNRRHALLSVEKIVFIEFQSGARVCFFRLEYERPQEVFVAWLIPVGKGQIIH